MQRILRVTAASVATVAAALLISTGTAGAATPAQMTIAPVVAAADAGATAGADASGVGGLVTDITGQATGLVSNLLKTIFGLLGSLGG